MDHKYLVLVDLAYSDASTKGKKNADAREFEIQTAELFTRELNFSGMRLGDANRPDVIISYETLVLLLTISLIKMVLTLIENVLMR